MTDVMSEAEFACVLAEVMQEELPDDEVWNDGPHVYIDHDTRRWTLSVTKEELGET